MLLIAGYPGFIQKIYTLDEESAYWQGIYSWKSQEYLEAYKRSFVFSMINKRAIKDSVNYFKPGNVLITDLAK